MIILLVVIGNKVVYENKFATIVGTMTLTANTQDKATNNRCTFTTKLIDYPNGFSSENCVVISCCRQNNSNMGYAYGWNNYLESLDNLSGGIPMKINLFGDSTTENANKIRLQMGNLSTNATDVKYKITLMKVQ